MEPTSLEICHVERRDWQHLKDTLRDHVPWIFRGQMDARWPLATSLERAVPDLVAREDPERLLLLRYKQVAKNYLPTGQVPSRALEWLGSMQHHGAPTRLLDFTDSPYVAAYFAVEDLASDGTAGIWAVHKPWCRAQAEAAIRRSNVVELSDVDLAYEHDHLTKWLYDSGPRWPAVTMAAPAGLPELSVRQVSQQAVFLISGDPSTSLLANLASLGTDTEPVAAHARCYLVPGAWRGEILTDLRKMNITRATLFPGIDGFARSLYYSLVQDEGWHEQGPCTT